MSVLDSCGKKVGHMQHVDEREAKRSPVFQKQFFEEEQLRHVHSK